MHPYTIFLFCICLSLSIGVRAQSVISGSVTDTTGNGIGGVSVTSKQTNEIRVLAYSFSNADGSFKFTTKREFDADSITLTFTHLAYESQTIIISNETSSHKIVMKERNSMLKEVRISKLPPVSRRKDTIAYAVDAFTFKGDRVIGDIIKKLPGIEMQGDQILYQGKPIQQFKVNNLDLMGGRYAMINKNLPADAVKNVQVIENDQPIKILDSLIISDRASLNLELKKFTSTGTGDVGIGLMPLLWNLSLTPMTFGKSFQMLNSLQSNNIGKDATKNLKPFYTGGTFFDAQINNTTGPSFLNLRDVTTPDFDEKKWLDNQVVLFSSNVIQKLKGGLDVRGNISYYNDLKRHFGFSATSFFSPQGKVLLSEDIRNTYRANDLEMGILVEKNEKHVYLRNRLNFHGRWNSDRGQLHRNQTESIYQDRSHEDFSLMNNLSIGRFIGKKLVSIQSDIEITKTPQQLLVLPGQLFDLLNGGIPYDRMRQSVTNSRFLTNNRVKLTHQFGALAVTPSLDVNYKSNKLQSFITTTSDGQETRLGESFTNDMAVNRFQISPGLRFDYRAKNWRIFLSAPYQLNIFNISKKDVNKLDNVVANTYRPSLFSIYNIDAKNELQASVNYSREVEDMDFFYNSNIATSYRSMKKYDTKLLGSTDFTSALSYRYKNTFSANFADVEYIFSEKKRDFLLSNSVGHDGQLIVEVLERPSQQYSHRLIVGYSRLFAGIKTTVKMNGKTGLGQSDYLLNNVVARQRSRSWEGILELENSSWDNLRISYKLDYGRFDRDLASTITNRVIRSNHSFDVNVYLLNNHRISFFNVYHRNNIEGMSDQYFLDAEYQWTIKKLKTDIRLSALNIFDTRRFVQHFSDEYQLIVTDFELRPRQVLLSTHFRF